MDFFNSAIDVLQTLVIALGGGLCVWGGIVGASRVKVQNSYCLETALINGKEAKTLTLYGIKTSVGGSVLTASVVGQIDDKAGNSDCGELVNCGLCNANGEAITDEQQ